MAKSLWLMCFTMWTVAFIGWAVEYRKAKKCNKPIPISYSIVMIEE